jgi:cation diffusion facilitator family transporter
MRSGSTALLATAWDYRLDALSGVGVLIGVAQARWAGWPWADHKAAVLVAGTVLWIGGGLLWENVQSLIDRQAEPELLERVRAEARSVPGVLAVERLRMRRMGIEHIAEIHVQFGSPAGDEPTAALRASVRRHRSAQGGLPMLRSIRPKRARPSPHPR